MLPMNIHITAKRKNTIIGLRNVHAHYCVLVVALVFRIGSDNANFLAAPNKLPQLYFECGLYGD
jgi:hypothetical protein